MTTGVTTGVDTTVGDQSVDSRTTGTAGVGLDTSSTTGFVFDVGTTDLPQSCRGPGGSNVFSYIWIANTQYPATLSKIDTDTMVEEGRYATRPDYGGSPSRTSVNLNGDAAVANRDGGVTMFYARTSDCVESNGTVGIQSSIGSDDVLSWEQEECRAWHTPLNYTSNRPVAWTPGVWDRATCRYQGSKLWTGATLDNGSPEVLLLDGETGVVEQTIVIPEIIGRTGLYGGAVDGDGHFWAIEVSGQTLVRVDRNTFAHQVWTPPAGGYGIAVDSVGRPWLCADSVSRFDPVLETWETAFVDSDHGGCMTDGNGTLWLSHNPLLGIDTDTLEVVKQWPLPGEIHGVSIDFAGKVWGVQQGSAAFRVDPDTGEYETVTNLGEAYTYSDMTGFGLAQAGVPAG